MKRLDLATLTWHNIDSVPYSSVHNLASFEINNEWYVGLGYNWDSLSKCYGDPLPSKKFFKFNPVTNKWIRLADFPGGDESFPAFFSLSSKGYAFLGAIPLGRREYTTKLKQELWEYNPTLNKWSQIPLPSVGGPPPGEKYQIITNNGKAYFLTAQTLIAFATGYGFWPQNPCLEYDPVKGTFTKISYMKTPEMIKPIGKIGNTIYFQSDALGFVERVPNKTFSLNLE